MFLIGLNFMSTNQYISTMLLAIIPGLTFLAFSYFSKDIERAKYKALWVITILMILALMGIKKWIP